MGFIQSAGDTQSAGDKYKVILNKLFMSGRYRVSSDHHGHVLNINFKWKNIYHNILIESSQIVKAELSVNLGD